MDVADWTIIVVEDTYDDVQLISTILQYYGIKVYVAHNGDECLSLLSRIEPTVIVTDLAMPGRDGWQTLAAVRADPATAGIPVVAVTAYHSASVAEEVRKAGFDGFCPKPVDPLTFVDQLRSIVGG